jgi:chemosensory pili system protein ChpA (sensor histidine kinase/response regulator)
MAAGAPPAQSELAAAPGTGLAAPPNSEGISIEAAEPERVVMVRTARPAGRAGRGPATGAPSQSIRVKLDRLDSMMNLVGELMIARSRLTRRLTELDRVGEMLLFSRSRLGRAVRDFEGEPHAPSRPAAGAVGASIPVPDLFAELEFDRYDDFDILTRSVGEISADVGLAQTQQAALLRTIRDDVEHIQRLTAALRKEVTRVRMIPIGRVFTRFARQVREAARAAGKTIVFQTHGESAEVDSAVVEQVSDSLLHVVQNAIWHGIEPASERLARGKGPQGTVSLRAYHQGGFVFVEVEDDGRGIDAELVRRRAVERGLLRPEAARALSTAEALNLIFVPGFSTAPEVTKASGRGVGLDVVRTNVSRLNGEVEVETEVGARTRVTFKLPLTVAIADALMVRVGAEVLAIPLTTVGIMRLVEPTAIQSVGDRETIELDGQVMELVRLDRALGLRSSEPAARVPVVVLRSGGLPLAVAVDELLGKEEIVVKSLGEFLEGRAPFAGATISGEGRVILLVDPIHLFEMSRAATRSPVAGGSRIEPSAFAPAAAPSILLVDDSISVRKFVGQMLERAGFRVFPAADGQDALQQLTQLSVDAVVTDLEMPRVNGYALIEDLRRRPGTRTVPVVILTTRAGDKHVRLARRLGVHHYVTKPVEEEAFVRLIESVLSPASSEAALSGVWA